MELSSRQSAHNEFYDRPGDAIKKPQRSSKRPIAVTIASILLIAGALLHLGVAFFLMSLSEPSIPRADIFRAVAPLLILEVVLSSLLIVAAIGMLVMKPWARKLGIWLAIFGFILWALTSQILGPMGFLVYSILLGLLMKTGVRRAFYNQSPHPTEERIYEVTPPDGRIGDTRDRGAINYLVIMTTLVAVDVIVLMLALAYDSGHTTYTKLLLLCIFGTAVFFVYGRKYIVKAQLVIDKQRIAIRKRQGKERTTIFEARLDDVDSVRVSGVGITSANAIFIELKDGQTVIFLVFNTFGAFYFLKTAFDDLGIGYETSGAKGTASVLLGRALKSSASGFVLKLK